MRRVVSNNSDKIGVDNYLTFVALEDDFQASLSVNACEYCIDGDGLWKLLPAGELTDPIKKGQMVSFRANLTPTSSAGIGTFSATKYFEARGNCMSMLFGDNGKNNFSLFGKGYAFRGLFKNSDKLVSTSTSILPATMLDYGCYYGMFSACTNLIKTPELPSRSLADSCYYAMFSSCSSLIIANDLLAKTAKPSCYTYMFNSCTSLTTPPEISLTKLANHCCYTMFGSCSSLKISPILHSTILAENCYTRMFEYCKSLSKISMFATDISLKECLNNWVKGVSSLGTFVKAKDVEIPSGTSGIPNGWTVIEE